MSLSRKTKLTAWLVLGIIMALGPILGTLPTAIGMAMTFRNLDQGGRQAEIFDRSIEIGTWSTLAGFAACPVGIAIAIVSAVKLSRNKNS